MYNIKAIINNSTFTGIAWGKGGFNASVHVAKKCKIDTKLHKMSFKYFQLLTLGAHPCAEEVGRVQFSLVTPTHTTVAYSIHITV